MEVGKLVSVSIVFYLSNWLAATTQGLEEAKRRGWGKRNSASTMTIGADDGDEEAVSKRRGWGKRASLTRPATGESRLG